jgi:hypothetical protein
MKAILCFLFLAVCFDSFAQTPGCPCTASTQKANQHRSGAKHVTNYDNFILKEDTITVTYINKWEKKYKSKTKTIKTTPGNVASERKHDTPEDTLYILKGFMWFVKQEDNDCDLHIEIGPQNVLGNRIVVEVAKENSILQQKILDTLFNQGLKIMNCSTSNTKTAHFDEPLPVIVTGLGFYDASHKPKTNHGDVHTRKYSWELHPVRDIIFE